MNRTTRLAAVVGLAALALTACDAGPSRGNAAAVVGDDTISLSALTDQVQGALADGDASAATSDRATFQAGLLSVLVQGKVSDQAAKAAGAAVSSADESEARTQLAAQVGTDDLEQAAREQGFSTETLRILVRARAERVAIGEALTKDVQVSQAELQKAYDAAADDHTTVDLRVIVVNGLAAAQTLRAQAAGLSDEAFGTLAQQQSIDDETKANGGLLAAVKRSQLTNAGQAFVDGAFTGAVGSTFAVASPSDPTVGFVVRVVKRDTVTLAQATPELRQTLLAARQEAATDAALAAVRVRINPRFGSWDPAKGVVPRDGKSATSVLAGTPTTPGPVPSLLD